MPLASPKTRVSRHGSSSASCCPIKRPQLLPDPRLTFSFFLILSRDFASAAPIHRCRRTREMTLYYLGGVIGVVLIGLLLYWLMPHRSKPALGTRRERTRQIDVRPAREKAVQAELYRSRNEAAEVEAALAEAKQTAASHDPIGGSLLVIVGFAGLLLIYWQIEAVVFYLLSAQSGFMEIAPETWAALAPPL